MLWNLVNAVANAEHVSAGVFTGQGIALVLFLLYRWHRQHSKSGFYGITVSAFMLGHQEMRADCKGLFRLQPSMTTTTASKKRQRRKSDRHPTIEIAVHRLRLQVHFTGIGCA